MLKFVRGLCAAVAAAALLAVAAPACAQAPATPTPDNPWVTLAPFPEPFEDLLGATAGGKLYVFGGLAPGWRPKALVFEYDPANDTWSKKKPMPLGAHRFALASHGDRIYAFGGFKYPESGAAAWEPVNNAWEYDPASDSWKALAPMPSKRGAAAAAVVQGKIYVIGGAGAMPGAGDAAMVPTRRHMTVGTVEEYDPKTDSWHTRAALPTPRNHPAAATVNNRIYVIGGRIGSAFALRGSNTDIVEAYDPGSDSWGVPLERMPTPRSAAGWGIWKNLIVIAGGENQEGGALAGFRAVEAYDPARNQWKAMPTMPHPRRGLAAGVIGDRFYAVSGEPQPAAGGTPSAAPAAQALQLDLVK